jgi:hypothetical protein
MTIHVFNIIPSTSRFSGRSKLIRSKKIKFLKQTSMFCPELQFHLLEGLSNGGETHVERCELRHTPGGKQ